MKSPLELASRQFQRILLIKPSSLGDIIHALPVLAGLRHRYPDAHIAWLAGSSYAELLTAHPALTEVIPFDRRRYGRLGRSFGASISFVRFLRDLRSRRFDLVVDLQGLFRSGFLAWASRAPVRLGFANARELGAVFYTHRVAVPADVHHAADQNYLVADVLGFADVEQEFSLHVSEAVRQRVATTLAQSGLKDHVYAVLVPGTRWQTKMWPADRFAGLADLIHDRLGLAVVLIGIKSALVSDELIIVILCVILGALAGEFLQIEKRLEDLGKYLERKVAAKSSDTSSFARGFVTASLVFCVGSMAIVGSLESGLTGNHQTLFAKSILDGVTSVIFASAMGV